VDSRAVAGLREVSEAHRHPDREARDVAAEVIAPQALHL
jgi:hypothetical protein